ncbi:MAG: hypothetical protein ACKVOQ_04270 [Cyclobacteriaceae bacterium]
MKTLRQLSFCIFSFSAIAALMLCAGCKKSSTDPQPDLLTKKTWTVSSVVVDGVDKTSLFANMTLNFSDKTYTTTNGGGAWLASGTWTYATSSTTVITRNDGLQITIDELTETKLKLSFDWAKTTFGGRIQSVGGKNVFTFQ